MNRLQKTAAAFVAFTITLAGATFATAPLALVDLRPAASHHGVPSLAQTATASKGTPRLRHG